MAGGQVFVQTFLAGCKTLVEVQGLYLEHQTALDILQAEISSGWMPRFHNIKKMGVGVGGKEGKRRGLAPALNPFGVEVQRGIAFDGQQGAILRCFQVDVVFDRGEESEEVLFELETNEFFRAHVA